MLINDFTKPTFIIFSASWCGPCHALAPKLKEIYEDIKNDINFVYVTTDKKEDIKKWNAFMDEQNITWRSLASYQNATDISQQFFVGYIPYSILVMPDRSIKTIDINNDIDKAELYKLSQKSQSK